jgi:hypothetical protein
MQWNPGTVPRNTLRSFRATVLATDLIKHTNWIPACEGMAAWGG